MGLFKTSIIGFGKKYPASLNHCPRQPLEQVYLILDQPLLIFEVLFEDKFFIICQFLTD